MGAFVFGELHLHDDETERFSEAALRDDANETMGPDAAYVGRSIARAIHQPMTADVNGKGGLCSVCLVPMADCIARDA